MVPVGREIDEAPIIDGKQVGDRLATHSYDHHFVYLRGRRNRCMLILPFSASGALTSCRCADKNANFLRQAVNFASRNGRSANLWLKDKLLKDKLF
jgi:hypothetical protein